MKRNYMLMITMLLLAFFSATVGYAQVSLTATGGTLTGSYTTTKEAFDAINAGTHTGTIAITVTGTVTETASAVLNSSTAPASYAAVSIQPSGVSTITGYLVGGHLIDLNGADNVTIDGLNTGGNSLTISNTALGTSTAIRFYNDASNNLVQNCSLLASTGASFGVVYFGGGLVTGNDNNTVTFCNIGPAGADLPLNGIYSLGTSSVIDNSGNTISNNNIYNYFNAGASSNGMNINSNNSAWTIDANSFYQTASRTYTTGSLHSAITVLSGSGHIITNNFIGGSAPNAGGSAYTMTGAVTNRFYGISLIVGTASATSVQGNTITNFNLSTTQGGGTIFWAGILMSGGNANIGNEKGNTIGDGTTTGAITVTSSVTGGAAVGCFISSTGTFNVSRNSVGSMTALGSTTSVSTSLYGIYVGAGSPTIEGNIIGSVSVANSINSATVSTNITNAQTVIGIIVTSGVTVANSISGNTIANMNQAGTGTNHTIRGISYAGTGYATISNNIIHDLSGASANTTQSGGGVAVQGIIYTGTSPGGGDVTGNTIYMIRGTNTGAVATTVAGIGFSNPTNGTITKNIIYDIRNASTMTTATTPPDAVGILWRTGATATTIANNMISLGIGQTTNTQFIGILNSFSGTQLNVYFNSVYIGGTAASGALPSFCFYRGNNTATAVTTIVDVRDNLFNNVRTGGTGGHYAIANNYGTTASVTGWAANASNYNVLNAAAGTVGYWTANQTFASWKTASACDGNSISGIPVTFSNTAIANLHLDMGSTQTQLESGGVVIAAVTTDIDGDVRPGPVPSDNGGGTAPDFGADEFDGVPLDLTGPIIVYTPLLGTNSTLPRTLTATITDPSGVPTTTPGWPNLYWKKTGDPLYTAVTPTGIVGNQFTYTFGAGVSIGDVVSYYIVAQDNSAAVNLSAYPAGATGLTSNPPKAATPPTVPSSYTISTPLSGDYTIGLTGFNAITGNNITFQKVITKVMKEVTVEESVVQRPVEKGKSPNNSTGVDLKSNITDLTAVVEGDVEFGNQRENTAISSCSVSGQKKMVEVEEISWVPMINGIVYNGPLSVTSAENPQLFHKAPIAGVYATITAAIADLNLRGVSGAVRFLLNDLSYTTGETYPIIVNVLNENLPTASNTVTIKPNTGVTSSVSGASAGAEILRIYNTSYVTIDGSNTIGGTTRDLTISNTSISAPEVIDINSVGTTPVVGAGVKNCNVINGSNGSSAIIVSDLAGNAAYFNNITIQNNSVQNAYIGIYGIAVATAGNGSGTIISGNDLNSSGTSSIRLVGIYMQGIDGSNVSNNNIGNIANTVETSNLTGIWLATGNKNALISGNIISAMSGTATAPRGIVVSSGVSNANIDLTGNTISGLTSGSAITTCGMYVFGATSGVTVQKNRISNIKNTNISGYGCNGIDLSSTLSTANITVTNNFIYDVAAYGWAGGGVADNGNGIVLESGAGYGIYNNSVALNTNQTVAGYPAALNVLSAVTAAGAINLRNNIFSNSQTVGTQRYAVYCAASNAVFSAIDNNDYFTTGANLGYMTTANVLDLAAWKTATGKDVNSVFGDPKFMSLTNLDIQPAVYSPVRNAGVTIPGIPDDYYGTTRLSPPDIGAYEDGFAQLSVTGTETPALCFGNSDGSISTVVTGGLPSYSYLWSNGETTSFLSGWGAGPYSVTVTDANSSVATGSWIIVQPTEIELTYTIVDASCPTGADGSISLGVSGGTPDYTFSWGNGAVTQNISGLNPGTYSVAVTDANGCQKTGSYTVGQASAVCNNITVTGFDAGPNCYNAVNTITVAGGATTYTVKAPSGDVTFIAGHNILFEPGTKVEPGAKMWGKISTTYCPAPTAPMTAAVAAGTEEAPMNLSNTWFTLYPNPTNGNFTLVQKGEKPFTEP
ncbi:MAG: hypothetical protein NTW16_18985 [Bacteroidetes bacterium]|nr:hypothetical protein [Bacteroidota bacterium]